MMSFNEMVLRKDYLEGKICFLESAEITDENLKFLKEVRQESADLEKKIKDHWEKERQEKISRKKADLKNIKDNQKNKSKEQSAAKKELDKILFSKEYQEIKDKYKAMEKEVDRLKKITSSPFNLSLHNLDNREISYLEKEIDDLEKEVMPEISVLAGNIRGTTMMTPKKQINRFV